MNLLLNVSMFAVIAFQTCFAMSGKTKLFLYFYR